MLAFQVILICIALFASIKADSMPAPRRNNVIGFRLSGEDEKHLARMAKEAGNESISNFAKVLLLAVIDDDRRAHEGLSQAAE